MLGDLGSEQFVEVVLRLTFPFGSIGQDAGAIVSVTDRDSVFAAAGQARMSWDYADDVTNDHQPRDREVDRVVARMFSARATQEAVRLNRQGDYQGASRLLQLHRRAHPRVRPSGHGAPRHGRRARGDRVHLRGASGRTHAQGRQFYASANMARSRTSDGRFCEVAISVVDPLRALVRC